MQRTQRRVKKGVVVSNKMKNTVIVRVDRTIRHPQYEKIVKRAKRYYAHDDTDALQIGQTVTIAETRPLSKTKCWRVVGQTE